MPAQQLLFIPTFRTPLTIMGLWLEIPKPSSSSIFTACNPHREKLRVPSNIKKPSHFLIENANTE